MEAKIKHLEFIENVIERMARNSFMLKGWAITIFAGVLALADTNHVLIPLIATIVTTIMFWYLDSFYLQQERLSKNVYIVACMIKLEQHQLMILISHSKTPKKNFLQRKIQFVDVYFLKLKNDFMEFF